MAALKSEAQFTPEELWPTSGEPHANPSAASAAALAKATATFDTIYIGNPGHNAVFAGYERLRQLGIANRGKRQRGVRNLSPTGSGKTTVAEAYSRWVADRSDSSTQARRVVIAPLDFKCTTKGLWRSVLLALDAPFSQRGDETNLRLRGYDALTRCGTELLVVDEVQHLGYLSSERADVTDALKRILDDGVVPVVFSGTLEAQPMLERNHQLSGRLDAPCDIRPLDVDTPDDRQVFRAFVTKFDEEMTRLGITRRPSQLNDPRTLTALAIVSGGVLGRVGNLIRASLVSMVERDADFIEPHDLAVAVDRYAVGQKLVTSNPFGRVTPVIGETAHA